MYRYFTDLDFRWATQGGLKMLSIRLDSIESTRIVSPGVDSSCRKSICKTRLRANRVESSSALGESTQFLCIGHECCLQT